MNVNAARLGCRLARSRSRAGMEPLAMAVRLRGWSGRREISAESRFVSYCPGGAPTYANRTPHQPAEQQPNLPEAVEFALQIRLPVPHPPARTGRRVVPQLRIRGGSADGPAAGGVR